jgi:hypothetical protein
VPVLVNASFATLTEAGHGGERNGFTTFSIVSGEHLRAPSSQNRRGPRTRRPWQPLLLPGKDPTKKEMRCTRDAWRYELVQSQLQSEDRIVYVATREEGTRFYIDNEILPGDWFPGGGIAGIPGVEPTGSISPAGRHGPDCGSSSCTLHPGPVCFPQQEDWHSAAPAKAIFRARRGQRKAALAVPTGGYLRERISLSEGKQHVAMRLVMRCSSCARLVQ